ncbi:MAG: GTPase Era [Ruminococcaceae bacterium]|nr:GTPase Era [Oscillospiraceae bacterium]
MKNEFITKTGFIAIVGRPNVGKSTLLNALMGEKIAAVSKKPQTTRNRITGILTKKNVQYVFCDTPGMHIPRTKLGDRMIKEISTAVADVDVALMVVEPEEQIHPAEKEILDRFKASGQSVILIVNKCDVFKGEIIPATIKMFSEQYEFASVIPISAMEKENLDIIFKELEPFITEGDWFFPSDMITDQPERAIAAETIREKLLRLLDKEIPHGTAVVIEGFEDVRGHLLKIRAEIFCEKESHKRIIIGKDGAMLKKIGTYARQDLEAFFGVKVNLDLWVKVKENWRDNELLLNNFGFPGKE